jgi:predicted AAA+ superfamily ATPase
MTLHPRTLLPILQARLSRWPITVLTGARQTGKTTLVRDLLPAAEEGVPVYYSLDDPDERLRLGADPIRRLDHGTRLVILDEVQKLPVLLDAVKVLADRKAGHRFLLLGSAQVLLLRQVRETLAGRATLLDLWPLALVERVQGRAVPPSGLDVVYQEGEEAVEQLSARPPALDAARHWRQQAEDHLRWGGYPALGSLPEGDRPLWLRGFRRTYLERDLADLGRVADLDQFALGQNLLAARTAQLLSYSEVARELGVVVNTVKRYVRFLELSYQGYLLQPLLPTVTARLVKSPKFYWTDVGLARLLAERPNLDDGPIFETAILGEILRWRSWQADPPALHFFRVHGGREIDFVLHTADRCLLLEVKAGTGMRSADVRALAEAVESIRIPGLRPRARRLGLMVTRGREVDRLAPRVWAVPYWRLFGPSK